MDVNKLFSLAQRPTENTKKPKPRKYNLELIEKFVEKSFSYYREKNEYPCLPISAVREYFKDNDKGKSPYVVSSGLYLLLKRAGITLAKLRGFDYVEVVIEKEKYEKWLRGESVWE